MADQERKPKEGEQEEAAQKDKAPQAFDKEAAEREEKQRNEVEEEEARKRSVVRQSLIQRFDGVAGAMKHELGQNPHYEPDPRLSEEENRALEIVYRVKVGQDEDGNRASARTRRLLLNHALSTIQPVLSVALAPELRASLEKSYQQVQHGIEELRDELATATLMQMHTGRSTLKPGPVDQVEAEEAKQAKLSQLGDLAWELVKLGQKRKRLRFPYDPAEHPVGRALGAITEQAGNLVALAAKLAANAAKLAKADPDRTAKLQADRDAISADLAEVVREFLAMCRPDQTATDEVGPYPSLRQRFAPLVDQHQDVASVDQALAAARALVEVTHWCVDHVDEIVAAESRRETKP